MRYIGITLIFLFALSLVGCSRCSRSGRTSNRMDSNRERSPLARNEVQPDQPSRNTPQLVPSQIAKGDCVQLPSKSSVADIAEATAPGTFLVLTLNQQGDVIKQGSGFMIDSKGVGVSNEHVFQGGYRWLIQTKDQAQYEVTRVLKSSDQFDFVVFEVRGGPFTCLAQASKTPRVGDDILVLGNPRGLEQTLTRGVISSLRAMVAPDDLIQIDAAISPGSSGSPVLNMDGKVVGIATLKIKDCENCNFAYNIQCLEREGTRGEVQ